MSYDPATDFLALLRTTNGGVRTERMPGLDWAVSALARAGLISLVVSQTAPQVNQATTVWFKPATASWVSEGVTFIWNADNARYEQATPTLWSFLIAGPFLSLIPTPGEDVPEMDGIGSVGTSLLYSREDHVHPTDSSRAPLDSPVFINNPRAPTAALGDASTLLATTAFVIANGGLPPPIGTVIPYAGGFAPNANWALCNGQTFSRTANANLFAVIGIVFGAGDGTTTANLPDMRGRVPAGVDGGVNRLTTATMSSQALAGTGGAEQITLALSQVPAGITANGVTSTNSGSGSFQFFPLSSGSLASLQTQGAATANITPQNSSGSWTSVTSLPGTASVTSNNTGGGAHNNVQPTIELNYLIRIA